MVYGNFLTLKALPAGVPMFLTETDVAVRIVRLSEDLQQLRWER